VRVATFNVLHGVSLDDGLVDVARFGEAVRALDADVLALQEVDRGQERSHGLDLTEIAAEAMGATWHRFAPTVLGTPGEDWRPASDDDGGPAYGVALLSRLPVLDHAVITMTPSPVRSPIVLPGPRTRVVLLRDEPRAAIVALVDAGETAVTVTGTHLSFVPGWNVRQLLQLRRELRGWPAPTAIAGDLNLPGPVPARLTGWRRAVVAPTYPSTGPRVQLDHVLVTGGFRVTSSGATRLDVSDHCAAYADLEV
jgi:endonuclease/exonuclease/phosphatase family metal-dependent hydrolase